VFRINDVLYWAAVGQAGKSFWYWENSLLELILTVKGALRV